MLIISLIVLRGISIVYYSINKKKLNFKLFTFKEHNEV